MYDAKMTKITRGNSILGQTSNLLTLKKKEVGPSSEIYKYCWTKVKYKKYLTQWKCEVKFSIVDSIYLVHLCKSWKNQNTTFEPNNSSNIANRPKISGKSVINENWIISTLVADCLTHLFMEFSSISADVRSSKGNSDYSMRFILTGLLRNKVNFFLPQQFVILF